MSRKIMLVLAVLSLGPVAPAGAGDGVMEINQARALAGAITGSLVDDPPGFPVRITQPGSYRLTGNLTVPDGNTTAISIGTTAKQVTIDLNGFAIVGPNQVILGSPPTCTAGGAGGIGRGVDSAAGWTVVRNGYVRGMGQDGVYVQGPGRIEGVIATDNCGIGLIVGTASTIVDSIAQQNFSVGIYVASWSLVKNSVAVENVGNGIFALDGSSVLDCTSAENRRWGIEASNSAGIGRVTFSGNTQGWGYAGKNLDCNVIDGVTYCPGHP